MRAHLLLSVSALVVTAGCAPVEPRTDHHGLDILANTSVVVNVENHRIQVYPDPAPIIGASNGVIKWLLVLDPSDYVFPDDGISFSGSASPGKALPTGCTSIGDPSVRFRNCKPNRTRTQYQCNVVGKPELPTDVCYFYVVKLVRVGGKGPPELLLDPWAKPK